MGRAIAQQLKINRLMKDEKKPIYEEKSYRLLFPMSFKVYKDRIEAYFCPIKYEIPISDIVGIKIVEKVPWWVGWGLRIDLWNKILYFVYHHGKCIEIERKNSYWRKVVLSVGNVDGFLKALNSLKSNQ